MVAAGIDRHVGFVRHVTLHALRAARFGIVKMVGGSIVFTSGVLMAGGAKTVSLRLQPGGVGVVAVRTSNSLGVHFALQKGTIDVDFVKGVATGVIQMRGQCLVHKMVIIGGAGLMISVRDASA